MNVKSKLLLSFLLVGTLLILDKQSCHGMDKIRTVQQQITKEYEQIKFRLEATRNIQKEVLKKTLEQVRLPSDQFSPTFIKIRDKTNQLLAKEQIKSEEIEALRVDLNEAAENTRSESERAEYEKMGEKFEFIQSIAELKDTEQRLNDIVERSHDNFALLDDREEDVSLWKDIFSGGFTVSFIANLIALLRFMIKMPNAKLEKQLKELLIIEKKAKLEQDGVDIKKYS
jgi:hypothetical protein